MTFKSNEKQLDASGSCDRCGKTFDVKGLSDFEKEDANCMCDGYVKYTTEDGQKVKIVLKADDEHVLKGYSKTIEVDEQFAYEDVKDAEIFYFYGVLACGASRKGGFICEVCGCVVTVNVTRNHVEINKTVVKEADCENEGSYTYNCKYADCQYHNTKATGTIPCCHVLEGYDERICAGQTFDYELVKDWELAYKSGDTLSDGVAQACFIYSECFHAVTITVVKNS